ncbi:MAG: chromate transporter [Proteobacteria bacterium]|nr:chromate transporter [Pseudomonadota bacterium]
MKDGAPIEIFLLFAGLSLIAVGGANTVIPEIHREAVDLRHWVTSQEFADLFAIARASPGPNMLIVSLIGWKAAGFWGALAATIGLCGPACTLTYLVDRIWERFRHTRWRAAVQLGLAPVTIGLVLASGYILTRATVSGWQTYGVVAATVVATLMTDINPLWLLAAAGLLGAFGVL